MLDTIRPELSYASTVPRGLVHRAAVCEVFLTDTQRRDEGEYWVAAQLPRVHSYYSDQAAGPASYDPLLLLEVFRQTSILVTHAHMDVPRDQKFSFNTGDLRILDSEALRFGDRPAHALIDVVVTHRKFRDAQLVGVSLRMRLSFDDRQAASMDMTIQWMPGHAWAKLRERNRATLTLPNAMPESGGSLPPSAVGRAAEQNVVLSEAVVLGHEVVSKLRVDQGHPALFDHPLDHIPAALLFEAYRQTGVFAAHELLGLSPLRLSMSRCKVAFNRFAELELPTTCHAQLVGDPDADAITLRMELRQQETVSTADVTLGCASAVGRAVRIPAQRAS
ncbi:ScbA/BarX family gamma-butyrolactone biosynthesis protein [Streptomyces sp. NPDC001904]|uniref:ScbA/BarX family gamma-butyrolactone biosynthesis protein n=1 Tax=Streptomyces sp. NPDC001904 TaxID=3154531 RepID=UPI003325A8B7